ncbi:CHAT domain-containing protein [Streptomyces sp. NPDC020192]|uniref:CHAT domain-containing WD40 repeat protein n=1 Tax=Streptomyces sp. NPDC020192 TaxID=3365066 RepID=UPI0037B1048C
MTGEFDFVLEMSEAPGGYSIEVSSPCGEDRALAEIDALGLLERLPSLQAAVLGSAVRSRGVETELETPVRQVGSMLYDAVFQSAIKALYLSSRQKAQERGQRLRMVLRVRAPDLAALPWELLHDAKLGGYLCLHHPIIRYVEILEPVSPLRVVPPLRILGMVSLPGSLGALDADAEKESLSTALEPLINDRMVQLDWVPGHTKQDLFEALLRGCHIFHFTGHGQFDDVRHQGMILFADEQGRPDPLHAEALGSLISVADPAPRLVVLNSCETGTSRSQDLFSSTAAELEYTVPAVVAMQFAVTDKAAVLFARAFYQALAANRPVDEAVRTGRIALRADKDDSLECFTPVLYQRSGDARLFDLTSPRQSTPPRTVVQEINQLQWDAGGARRSEERPTPRPPPPTPTPAPAPAPAPTPAASQRKPPSETFQRKPPSEQKPPPPRAPSPGITPRPEIDTGQWVVSLAVHPQGRLLATGARKLVRVWNVVTGEPTWERRLAGWSTMVNAIAFSPDGGRLAVGSTDNRARVWEMATGELVAELAHHHFVNTVDFDPTGRYLATGSADAVAGVWDLTTGSRVLSVRHARAVKDVTFSPDGRLLLTACEDKKAYVWDTDTGWQRAEIPHKHFVLGVAFSPDGRKIATCSENHSALISETGTWTTLFQVEHRSGQRSVAFSPDSSMFATGSQDGAVCVWRADTGLALLTLKHHRSVNALAFYPDGRYLASAGEDKVVRSTLLPELDW